MYKIILQDADGENIDSMETGNYPELHVLLDLWFKIEVFGEELKYPYRIFVTEEQTVWDEHVITEELVGDFRNARVDAVKITLDMVNSWHCVDDDGKLRDEVLGAYREKGGYLSVWCIPRLLISAEARLWALTSLGVVTDTSKRFAKHFAMLATQYAGELTERGCEVAALSDVMYLCSEVLGIDENTPTERQIQGVVRQAYGVALALVP